MSLITTDTNIRHKLVYTEKQFTEIDSSYTTQTGSNPYLVFSTVDGVMASGKRIANNFSYTHPTYDAITPSSGSQITIGVTSASASFVSSISTKNGHVTGYTLTPFTWDIPAGTVTSVDASIFTDTNVLFNSSTSSSVTTTGTLALNPSLKAQAAKTVLAGPTSGGSAAPTFRQLTSDDINGLGTAITNSFKALTIKASGSNVGTYTPSRAQTIEFIPGTDKFTIKVGSATASISVANANSVTSTDTLTGNKIILGNGNKTIKTSSYEIVGGTGSITSSSTDNQIPTSLAVYNLVTSNISEFSKALVLKGTIGSGSEETHNTLPASHTAGDVYYAATGCPAINGTAVEVGDMIVCVKSGTSASDADWRVVNANWTTASGSSALNWNETVTLGTVGGLNIDATLPSKPVTSINSANGDITLSTAASTASGNNTTVQFNVTASGAVTGLVDTNISASVSAAATATNMSITFVDGLTGSNKSITGTSKTIGFSTGAATNTNVQFSIKNGLIKGTVSDTKTISIGAASTSTASSLVLTHVKGLKGADHSVTPITETVSFSNAAATNTNVQFSIVNGVIKGTVTDDQSITVSSASAAIDSVQINVLGGITASNLGVTQIVKTLKFNATGASDTNVQFSVDKNGIIKGTVTDKGNDDHYVNSLTGTQGSDSITVTLGTPDGVHAVTWAQASGADLNSITIPKVYGTGGAGLMTSVDKAALDAMNESSCWIVV